MYKNQLQELAQRSCFNLPSYSCVREGPDHAPRFKSSVNFNGETFESPTFCSTLRQAEHAAAEVALNTLANRGPSRALAARVLDETGVYKNLLQETAHRAGLNLPIYTTVRSGPGHVPVFSCTVEIAGLSFSGEPAKTKKQAQKNAAMAAWLTLKQLAQRGSSSSTSPCSSSESEGGEEQEQVAIARVLASKQSAEAKSAVQNVLQDRPHKSIRNSRDPNPVASRFYPVQYETCTYSSYPTDLVMYRPTDLAMYRLYQQAQLSHLQSLPAQTPMMTPQVLPVMPPFLHPDHFYFTIGEQELFLAGPGDRGTASRPFYLSNPPPSPTPTRGRSMVTIQEIKEEKTEGSLSEILNSPVISGYKMEEVIQGTGTVQENNKLRSGILEAKIGDAGQQEMNAPGHFSWVPSKSVDAGFLPHEMHVSESSQFNHRPRYSPGPTQNITQPPLSMAAPVRIRNAGPVPSSVGVRQQNLANRMPVQPKMKSGTSPNSIRPRMGFGVPSRFMAPAVQIRSVVPVCSAPPTRKIISASSQDGNSTNQEKSSEQEDTSVMSSELSKLQM